MQRIRSIKTGTRFVYEIHNGTWNVVSGHLPPKQAPTSHLHQLHRINNLNEQRRERTDAYTKEPSSIAETLTKKG